MKCPHCAYEHKPEPTWDSTEGAHLEDEVYGNSGDFFKLPVQLERKEPYSSLERIALYACPSCMKTFVEGG